MAPLETPWRDGSPSRPILAAKQPSLFLGVTVFRQLSRRFCRRYLTFISVNPNGIAPSSSAIPEPGQFAASLLFLSGIGGYVFLKRRKTAKTAPAA